MTLYIASLMKNYDERLTPELHEIIGAYSSEAEANRVGEKTSAFMRARETGCWLWSFEVEPCEVDFAWVDAK